VLLLVPLLLWANGNKEYIPEPKIVIDKVTETQDLYNNMIPASPGMVMFGTTATTIVPIALALKVDEELSRQLVVDGKIKPVLMQKWLSAISFEDKISNPFMLMDLIQDENYVLPLQYLCKPFLFQCENYFILHVNIYPLAKNGAAYPVSILRMFESDDDIPKVIEAVIDEMQIRLHEENRGVNKKRIVVDSFILHFLKLIALESGEFEFIEAPFIDRYGAALYDGDDFFSTLLGYILSTTNLFEVMRSADFSDFTLSSNYNSSLVDYLIQGRVQLSTELGVLYVTVRNVQNNSIVTSVQFPLRDFSLKNIWNA
jgi:hypothetical protein